MSRLPLAGPGAAPDLAAFAGRVADLDAEALVRLVVRGRRLGAFATTPLEVLALRTTLLEGSAAADGLDVVVEAGTLAARARAARDGVLEPPNPVPPLRWTQPLPPSGGWRQVGGLAATAAVAAVERAVAAFRDQAQVPPSPSRAAAVQGIADDVWAADLGGGVPVRLAHAALLLGFVDPAAEVRLHAAGPWRRLDATYGSILARTAADPLGLLF